jgi:hypothetical protein
MKWILVWWIINPGHSQQLHLERGFESESKCLTYAAQLQARDLNKLIRYHCSQE